MTKTIEVNDRNRFEDIKKQLLQIGCKESEFIRVELLFYEALTISRNYGKEPGENELLAALKNLEANEYGATRQLYTKSKHKEKVIRQFIHQFKNVLTHGIKNDFLLTAG